MTHDIIVDPAFKAIPESSTYFLVWRIEKLQVVPIPKEDYGNFYDGDSYIVAVASEDKESVDSTSEPHSVRNKDMVEIHIHFWLGSETSQDESTVAAYKTVELDDFLGGSPVQHREVQGYESSQFLSYFRSGLRLLKGGVASGLTKVDTSMKPKLMQVKGKRMPLIKEVPEVSWALMNDGDVFILDAGTYVYLWVGTRANNMEKIQGARVAQKMKGEHGAKCKGVVVIESGKESDDMSSRERIVFNKLLNLAEKQLKPKSDEKSDIEVEMSRKTGVKLYRCSDETGVTEVKSGPLFQADLKSEDSFIVDNNVNGIWVWIGKKASKKERQEAMKSGQGFVTEKKYPQHTQVTRVIEGGEPLQFKSLFKLWRDPNMSTSLPGRGGGRLAKMKDLHIESANLENNHVLASEIQMPDDGHGEKEVFLIKGSEFFVIDSKDWGNFFNSDCFLVIYKYKAQGKERTIIYRWIGSLVSEEEKAKVRQLVLALDEDKFKGTAVLTRVLEGKESPHFTAIFGGKMIVYKGKFQVGYRSEGAGAGGKYLLRVQGTNRYVTRALEVDCVTKSLNSNDVFVLNTESVLYLWLGKRCSTEETQMGRELAARSKNKQVVDVPEGQETDAFWGPLGGKSDYTSEQETQSTDAPHPPRLFQCSNAKGQITIEEIPNFRQSDLVEDDVMLLDTWDILFLWVGKKSNQAERAWALRGGEDYLQSHESGRDMFAPSVVIKEGHEPTTFTGFFGTWDANLWEKSTSYESMKSQLAFKEEE